MMIRLITFLATVAIGVARNTVQVTVVNDRTAYSGDIYDTTVDVPTPGRSSQLSFPNAVSLSLTGAQGLDVGTIVCTPTWLNNDGGVTGTSFTFGQVTYAIEGSIGLHLLECAFNTPSQQPFGASLQKRGSSWQPYDHGPPDFDCMAWALHNIDAEEVIGCPAACECFNGKAINGDNIALEAIQGACDYFSTGTISSETDWVYWHTYDPEQDEEGAMFLHIYWHGQDSSCNGDLDQLNQEFQKYCHDAFWNIFHYLPQTDYSGPQQNISGCGTSYTSPPSQDHQNPGGKGGWGTDACLVWEIDPNPAANNPKFSVGCSNSPSENQCPNAVKEGL